MNAIKRLIVHYLESEGLEASFQSFCAEAGLCLDLENLERFLESENYGPFLYYFWTPITVHLSLFTEEEKTLVAEILVLVFLRIFKRFSLRRRVKTEQVYRTHSQLREMILCLRPLNLSSLLKELNPVLFSFPLDLCRGNKSFSSPSSPIPPNPHCPGLPPASPMTPPPQSAPQTALTHTPQSTASFSSCHSPSQQSCQAFRNALPSSFPTKPKPVTAADLDPSACFLEPIKPPPRFKTVEDFLHYTSSLAATHPLSFSRLCASLFRMPVIAPLLRPPKTPAAEAETIHTLTSLLQDSSTLRPPFPSERSSPTPQIAISPERLRTREDEAHSPPPSRPLSSPRFMLPQTAGSRGSSLAMLGEPSPTLPVQEEKEALLQRELEQKNQEIRIMRQKLCQYQELLGSHPPSSPSPPSPSSPTAKLPPPPSPSSPAAEPRQTNPQGHSALAFAEGQNFTEEPTASCNEDENFPFCLPVLLPLFTPTIPLSSLQTPPVPARCPHPRVPSPLHTPAENKPTCCWQPHISTQALNSSPVKAEHSVLCGEPRTGSAPAPPPTTTPVAVLTLAGPEGRGPDPHVTLSSPPLPPHTQPQQTVPLTAPQRPKEVGGKQTRYGRYRGGRCIDCGEYCDVLIRSNTLCHACENYRRNHNEQVRPRHFVERARARKAKKQKMGEDKPVIRRTRRRRGRRCDLDPANLQSQDPNQDQDSSQHPRHPMEADLTPSLSEGVTTSNEYPTSLSNQPPRDQFFRDGVISPMFLHPSLTASLCDGTQYPLEDDFFADFPETAGVLRSNPNSRSSERDVAKQCLSQDAPSLPGEAVFLPCVGADPLPFTSSPLTRPVSPQPVYAFDGLGSALYSPECEDNSYLTVQPCVLASLPGEYFPHTLVNNSTAIQQKQWESKLTTSTSATTSSFDDFSSLFAECADFGSKEQNCYFSVGGEKGADATMTLPHSPPHTPSHISPALLPRLEESLSFQEGFSSLGYFDDSAIGELFRPLSEENEP